MPSMFPPMTMYFLARWSVVVLSLPIGGLFIGDWLGNMVVVMKASIADGCNVRKIASVASIIDSARGRPM